MDDAIYPDAIYLPNGAVLVRAAQEANDTYQVEFEPVLFRRDPREEDNQHANSSESTSSGDASSG